jgi:hypothetical protein
VKWNAFSHSSHMTCYSSSIVFASEDRAGASLAIYRWTHEALSTSCNRNKYMVRKKLMQVWSQVQLTSIKRKDGAIHNEAADSQEIWSVLTPCGCFSLRVPPYWGEDDLASHFFQVCLSTAVILTQNLETYRFKLIQIGITTFWAISWIIWLHNIAMN